MDITTLRKYLQTQTQDDSIINILSFFSLSDICIDDSNTDILITVLRYMGSGHPMRYQYRVYDSIRDAVQTCIENNCVNNLNTILSFIDTHEMNKRLINKRMLSSHIDLVHVRYHFSDAAVILGHLACLILLHQYGYLINGGRDTMEESAICGYLECLVYLHENGCPWDAQTSELAAGFGHLECLVYLHEHGCPWDERTTAQACEHGHSNCFLYAYNNGCQTDDLYLYCLTEIFTDD